MGEVKMVDIGDKNEVPRIAIAEGMIRLRKETLRRIKEGKVEKGDVLTVAKIAAVLAVKRTWEVLPLCHPIPIEKVKVDIDVNEEYVKVTVEVKTHAKTGVEMEALTGTMTALLAIWDMVKAYEKDERGQYPHTRIDGVKVVEKIKGSG